jgi:hypothetical protein
MIWKGEELFRETNLYNILGNLQSKDEARAFLRLYAAEYLKKDISVAKADLAYISYSWPMPRRGELLDWFNAIHPYFGPDRDPTPEEAFAVGTRIGEGIKSGTPVKQYEQPVDVEERPRNIIRD